MSLETISQLKKTFLFEGLPENALAIVAEKISTQYLVKDETLFRKGDVGDALFMIDEGILDIVTEDGQGSQLILNQCGPGETIGEMSLLDEEPRSASVVAKTDAQVLKLKRDDFLEMFNQNPDTALLLIRSISSRLRFATTYIEKAIEWSGHIAKGDYTSAMAAIKTSESSTTDDVSNEAKANQLLSAFFQMIEEVQARENELKQQIKKLNFEIDQTRRKEEYEELTSSEFYTNLKSQARKLRQQRIERAQKYVQNKQETE